MTAIDIPKLFKKNVRKLTGADFKAFFALSENITFGGKVLKPQIMMAKEWSLDKSQFSASMRKFKEWKIVTINKNSFGQRYIQMNDNFIAKGRPSNKLKSVVNS